VTAGVDVADGILCNPATDTRTFVESFRAPTGDRPLAAEPRRRGIRARQRGPDGYTGPNRPAEDDGAPGTGGWCARTR
jgi:hypothetical protein